jgi:enoyl-CoA hydratase
MGELVLTDRPAEGVAVVTLNRPGKYNALSKALLADLDAAMSELGADETLRAIVLTGADPAFTAGIDLVELGEGTIFGPTAIDSVRNSPVPVIGAINGVAVTGGLELALACDFRIASEKARFADTHARVGVIPAWGLTARLPQAVGQSWARQMSFTGDYVDAVNALRIGLVNEVVPHDELRQRAVQLATTVAGTAAATAAQIRAIYALSRDDTGTAALAAELASGDELVLENPEEFAARRAAVFQRGRGQ